METFYVVHRPTAIYTSLEDLISPMSELEMEAYFKLRAPFNNFLAVCINRKDAEMLAAKELEKVK